MVSMGRTSRKSGVKRHVLITFAVLLRALNRLQVTLRYRVDKSHVTVLSTLLFKTGTHYALIIPTVSSTNKLITVTWFVVSSTNAEKSTARYGITFHRFLNVNPWFFL